MMLRLALLVWLVSVSAAAQPSEKGLRRLYRMTPDGVFTLSSGVTLKAVFDQHNEACTLILRGALSEDQVLRFFDLLVPAKIRGAKENEPFWCVNVCEHAMIYRNVTLLTGVTAKQTSDPAAIITFSRPGCKVAVAEANKTVLDIKK